MEHVEGLRYKRTLYVGLGGAGAKTLRKLKKKIQSANDGEVPKQVKFLLIDTNATELSNYRDFDSSEKICIAVREPYERYEHDKEAKLDTHKYIPVQNTHSLLALERGAGQIRSNGHFAVIENQYSNKLTRIFRERADELENIDVNVSSLEKDPKIEVRLVFSIAGGTGSGTFLPVATIIRAAIKHCELTAYIYSATHYENFVENSAKYSVMQNAYAALAELDYMMHFGRGGYEKIQFNFGPEENQKIVSKNSPFDEVYYIDKRTGLPSSDSVEFAYNEICRLQDNTAEIMHISSTNIITAHTGTVDNVRQKIKEGQFDVGDKFAWISGVGISELFLRKDNINNQKVIEAALKAISARLIDKNISEDIAQKIANKFNENDIRFDESAGDADGDPILRLFLNHQTITKACEDIVCGINGKKDPSLKSADFSLSLDDLMDTKKSESKIQELYQIFNTRLSELTKELVNQATYGSINIEDDTENGTTLYLIISILKKIQEILVNSQEQLDKEKRRHDKDREQEDNSISTILKGKSKKKQSFLSKLTPFSSPVIDDDDDDDNLAGKINPHQIKGLEFKILSERADKASSLFAKCITRVKAEIAMIESWISDLRDAAQYGTPKLEKGEISSGEDKKKKHEKMPDQNVVIVEELDLTRGFILNYEQLYTLSNDVKIHKIVDAQGKFDRICHYVKTKSINLKDYLKKGIEEIQNSSKDSKIKVERTECQKKIDRLIDLSTPTMQVDRHAYGDRVKVDSFWYVMTECPEENEGDKHAKTEDSIGEYLKKLIEQNSLEVKINKVHVPGWNDKAIVYRVDSAVPAYFVDGVCESKSGGLSLEGCYEELKKTKRTYTPFSHSTLQKLLENGRCVLKPHDEVNQEEAMEHWINFNLLGYIHFDSEKGTKGLYYVKSDKDGEILTNDFADNNKVLILGRARKDAYDTFARYCKTLTEEYSDYKEKIDPLEITFEKFEQSFVMSGEEYLDKIFGSSELESNLIWTIGDEPTPLYWRDLKNHLSKENPDHLFLRSEIAFMNNRKCQFEKQKEEDEQYANTSESFNDDDNSKD